MERYKKHTVDRLRRVWDGLQGERGVWHDMKSIGKMTELSYNDLHVVLRSRVAREFLEIHVGKVPPGKACREIKTFHTKFWFRLREGAEFPVSISIIELAKNSIARRNERIDVLRTALERIACWDVPAGSVKDQREAIVGIATEALGKI